MRLLLATIILLPIFCFSQRQGNIWYFGDKAGVDFNSGNPIGLTNGVSTDSSYTDGEGTTAISDSSGNLLFYSNGQRLINKNHLLMPNGDGLLGNYSSTQSSLIIPLPGSSEIFFAFTVDDVNIDSYKYGFRYSVVDICLDNGLGDVVSGQKNVLLLDTVTEKVAAVRHSNGIDYWVVTHKLFTDQFYSYKLTSAGIVDTVITHIGSVHGHGQGQLKFSPDGNKIAVAANQHWLAPYYFELFNFDNSTGVLSNLISLTTPTNSAIYGVEFSPDNSKLFGVYSGFSPMGTGIVQYDLSSGNQTAINSSMLKVYQQSNVATLRGLQLGPDNKIYQVGIYDRDYLMAINSPNSYGLSCNVQDSAVYLGGRLGIGGLPTFIAGYSYSNKTFNCPTNITTNKYCRQVTVFPNPCSDFLKINSSDQSSTLELKLFDFRGLVVYSTFFKHNDIISIDKLNSGLYFYQVADRSTKNVIVTGKVVKE
jgi:hypothetical protein